MKRLPSLLAGTAASLLLLGSPVRAEVVYGVVAGQTTFTLQSLDLATGALQVLGAVPVQAVQLTGFAVLSSGTFALTSTPTNPGRGAPTVNKLTLINIEDEQEDGELEASELDSDEILESAVTVAGSTLVSLANSEGAPPFRLVSIDPATGRASAFGQFALAQNRRYANLTECPDGRLYGTSLAATGYTRLVYLDAGQSQVQGLSELLLNEKKLRYDLKALACSAAGQLYALADPQRNGNYQLFKLDGTTGRLSLLYNVPFSKFAFPRP